MTSDRCRFSERGSLCAPLASPLAILLVFISAGLFAGVMSGCKSCSKTMGSAPGDVAEAPRDALELVFTYGSEKEKWIKEATDRFNGEDHRAPDGKRIFVRAIAMGSGECIDEVLEGRRQPHLNQSGLSCVHQAR